MVQSLIGDEKIGDFFLREFDEGIISTLKGELIGDNYYLPLEKVPGVLPPLFTEFSNSPELAGQAMPGIPFIFKNPGDETTNYVIPCIRVSREDPSPAMERWHSVNFKYRRPAPGANPVTVIVGNRTLEGYDKYETQFGAYPYDIPYTITFEANGENARTNAQTLVKHGMKIFGPHGVLTAYDSLGAIHKFEVIGEGPSDLSSAADVRDRTIIYALSLRVIGRFDLSDPESNKAVIAFPTQTVQKKV